MIAERGTHALTTGSSGSLILTSRDISCFMNMTMLISSCPVLYIGDSPIAEESVVAGVSGEVSRALIKEALSSAGAEVLRRRLGLLGGA